MANNNQVTAALFERIGLLLERGVPLVKTIETLSAETSDEYAGMLEGVAGLLKTGESFSDSLAMLEFLPDELTETIRVAEARGNLDIQLKQLAGQIAEGVFLIGTPRNASGLLQNVQHHTARINEITNRLIVAAVNAGASDLHLEPAAGGEGQIRFRIDGVLKKQPDMLIQKDFSGVVSRIKTMAALDVGEHKLPQDGRIMIKLGPESASDSSTDYHCDIRVSVCPFVGGEKVVMRFLDRNAFPNSLEDIRITSDKIALFDQWLSAQYGMILVSGPTGSGKTTTLYLLLQEIAKNPAFNIMSVEDPVEYRVPGVYQMQLNPAIGLTFPAAIRSLMRQDPDVICAGEIRNPETAALLAQAAQTGHLVLSQMHAQNAIATLRLIHDLGVPVHVLRETVIGVVSQRLVRRQCEKCKVIVPESERTNMPEALKSFSGHIFRAKGCDACYQTGYKGRDVIMELLSGVDSEFWRMLQDNATEKTLAGALPAGFQSLKDDGIARVMQGVTSWDEIERVCGDKA
jgi:type IV pilus assembly protein PilB